MIRNWNLIRILTTAIGCMLLFSCNKKEDLEINKEEKQVFEDQFNANSLWPQGSFQSNHYKTSISNGTYKHWSNTTGIVYCYYPNKHFTGMEKKQIIETSVRLLSGDGGFDISVSDDGLGYKTDRVQWHIIIDKQNRLFISNESIKGYVTLVPWTPIKNINISNFTSIRIELEQGIFRLFADKSMIYENKQSKLENLEAVTIGVVNNINLGNTSTEVEYDYIKKSVVE